MYKLKGDVLFPGYAFGKIVFRMKGDEEENHASQGAEIEKKRYDAALKETIEDTEKLHDKPGLSKANKDIVEAHLTMLEDDDFADLVNSGLQNGLSAERAIDDASKKLCNMLLATGDDYMSQRTADVVEISNQIKDHLSGKNASLQFTEPTILVSDSITVSQLLSLDSKFVKGLLLVDIGKASHVSIVERSLGFPALILDSKPSETLANQPGILDAITGKVYVDYEPNFYEGMKKVSEDRQHTLDILQSFKDKPTLSKDGVKTTLYANIATPEEAKIALKNGAEGIGLFRSEFIYMNSADYPTEEQQFNAYVEAVKDMEGRPVVIRTFDIGSDKIAPYFHLPKENNPALGYRSIRICYDRHDLFLTQLKALYRASAYGDLSIMIPMIISPKELDFVHEMCALAMADLDKRGIKYNRDMKVGIMIETPAAAITSDILAQKAKFFSIGTNDLSQYTLAIDRTNENLTKFFNPHAVGILRLMKITADNAHKYGIPVSICGELAHDEKLLGFFLKIGIDHLSMPSSYILHTRQLISEIDTTKVDLKDFID